MHAFMITFCLLWLCVLSGAAMERTTLEGMLGFPTKQINAPSLSNIKVTLNGNEYTAFTRADGAFTFYEVPEGIYSLDVLSLHILFPAAKIKVVAGSNAESGAAEASKMDITVVEYKYPGAPRSSSSYPIVLQALTPLGYFKPAQTFSLMSIVMANPMMLMMLGFGGLMVWMFNNMDPEMMKEMQEAQKVRRHVPLSVPLTVCLSVALSFFFSSYPPCPCPCPCPCVL